MYCGRMAPFVNHFMQTTSQTVGIDWNEVILLLIGAAIGLFSSVLILILERVLDRKGKLMIFYRFINSRLTKRGWGFEQDIDGRFFFTIPVYFELQNTSNTTRVIRDVSMMLYSGRVQVAKMIQADHFHMTKKSGNTITGEEDAYYGGEKGTYSFVLPPRSIQRQECEYIAVIEKSGINGMTFDRIKLRYYDEKNKAHFFDIREISDCWKTKHYEADEEWILLK